MGRGGGRTAAPARPRARHCSHHCAHGAVLMAAGSLVSRARTRAEPSLPIPFPIPFASPPPPPALPSRYPLPAVLRVPTHCRNPSRVSRVALNRHNIILRDQGRCQYCSSTKNLTIDHVVPQVGHRAEPGPASRACAVGSRLPGRLGRLAFCLGFAAAPGQGRLGRWYNPQALRAVVPFHHPLNG